MLAALSHNQNSAYEVARVIHLLLSDHAKFPEVFATDAEVGICLLRMGAAYRLSQLLRPLEGSSCSSMELSGTESHIPATRPHYLQARAMP